jgi:transglutaminase-like putative cysteine protease
MKTVACALIVIAFLMPLQGSGDVLLCQGTMASSVHYVQTREVRAPDGTQKLVVELPGALNATLFGYSLEMQSFNISYSKRPDTVVPTSEGMCATWINPPARLNYTINADLKIDVHVDGLNSESQFPVKLPVSDEGASTYLSASKYVQSNDSEIKNTAKALTNNTPYESAAVTSIMLWVSGNLKYDANVTSHDASWTFHNRRGTCENYAHLSLALLRSVGIPARYVSGYLVNGEIQVNGYVTSYGYRWDAGPHSWIEVYYPDLGWVPYEPQKTLGFVDDHHVREAVGADAADVPNKLIYTYTGGNSGRVTINDSSSATIVQDTSALRIVQTSTASNQRVMSQEMAHGGTINDHINVVSSEELLIWLALAVAVAFVVIVSSGLLLSHRRRR